MVTKAIVIAFVNLSGGCMVSCAAVYHVPCTAVSFVTVLLQTKYISKREPDRKDDVL